MKTLGAITLSGLLAVCTMLSATHTVAAQGLDENLPAYQPAQNLTGEITLIGSNTMSNVADVWRSSFLQYHPDVKINIAIKGSINAVPSVMSGEATFGLMSRSITASEVEAFQKQFNYPPKILTPCQELMALFIHKDNPVEGLTLSQVANIFAADGNIKTWGDAGVEGQWANQPIVLQGRAATTGSTLFMQNQILRGHQFKSMTENANYIDLVNNVADNHAAIGYAGMVYRVANTKPVPLAVREGQDFIDITSAEAALGRYPLMRPLQLVVNQSPGKELPPVQKEFLKYVFSRLGQEDVVKGGFQPVPAPNARFALDQVGLKQLN